MAAFSAALKYRRKASRGSSLMRRGLGPTAGEILHRCPHRHRTCPGDLLLSYTGIRPRALTGLNVWCGLSLWFCSGRTGDSRCCSKIDLDSLASSHPVHSTRLALTVTAYGWRLARMTNLWECTRSRMVGSSQGLVDTSVNTSVIEKHISHYSLRCWRLKLVGHVGTA